MQITRAEDIASRRASADYVTGTVWQDAVAAAPEPARIMLVRVSLEPGARTAWHTHPLGQTLFVLSGIGRAQVWGGPIQMIRPGDAVWFAPDEKHWHGATSASGLVHLAMHEQVGGHYVTWLEQVTDAQYGD